MKAGAVAGAVADVVEQKTHAAALAALSHATGADRTPVRLAAEGPRVHAAPAPGPGLPAGTAVLGDADHLHLPGRTALVDEPVHRRLGQAFRFQVEIVETGAVVVNSFFRNHLGSRPGCGRGGRWTG